jgi:D-galactarolactone cycloisomerase
VKITDIRAHVLRSPLEQPFAFSQGWVHSRGATLVEVTTDEGLVGWGEALCQGLQPPEIAAAAVRHALAPLVIGADPLEPEVLWHRMYHHTRDCGQKGALIGAISALDIAFWDIAGKARGEPVARLLGGMLRTRVQAYATGFYRIRGQGEAARLAQEAERHVAQGFSAFKVKLGFGSTTTLP